MTEHLGDDVAMQRDSQVYSHDDLNYLSVDDLLVNWDILPALAQHQLREIYESDLQSNALQLYTKRSGDLAQHLTLYSCLNYTSALNQKVEPVTACLKRHSLYSERTPHDKLTNPKCLYNLHKEFQRNHDMRLMPMELLDCVELLITTAQPTWTLSEDLIKLGDLKTDLYDFYTYVSTVLRDCTKLAGCPMTAFISSNEMAVDSIQQGTIKPHVHVLAYLPKSSREQTELNALELVAQLSAKLEGLHISPLRQKDSCPDKHSRQQDTDLQDLGIEAQLALVEHRASEASQPIRLLNSPADQACFIQYIFRGYSIHQVYLREVKTLQPSELREFNHKSREIIHSLRFLSRGDTDVPEEELPEGYRPVANKTTQRIRHANIPQHDTYQNPKLQRKANRFSDLFLHHPESLGTQASRDRAAAARAKVRALQKKSARSTTLATGKITKTTMPNPAKPILPKAAPVAPTLKPTPESPFMGSRATQEDLDSFPISTDDWMKGGGRFVFPNSTPAVNPPLSTPAKGLSSTPLESAIGKLAALGQGFQNPHTSGFGKPPAPVMPKQQFALTRPLPQAPAPTLSGAQSSEGQLKGLNPVYRIINDTRHGIINPYEANKQVSQLSPGEQSMHRMNSGNGIQGGVPGADNMQVAQSVPNPRANLDTAMLSTPQSRAQQPTQMAQQPVPQPSRVNNTTSAASQDPNWQQSLMQTYPELAQSGSAFNKAFVQGYSNQQDPYQLAAQIHGQLNPTVASNDPGMVKTQSARDYTIKIAATSPQNPNWQAELVTRYPALAKAGSMQRLFVQRVKEAGECDPYEIAREVHAELYGPCDLLTSPDGNYSAFHKIAHHWPTTARDSQYLEHLYHASAGLDKTARALLAQSPASAEALFKVASQEIYGYFVEELKKQGATEDFILGMEKEARENPMPNVQLSHRKNWEDNPMGNVRLNKPEYDGGLDPDRNRIFSGINNNMLGAGGGAMLGGIISSELGLKGLPGLALPAVGLLAGHHFLPQMMNSWKDGLNVGANAVSPVLANFNQANNVIAPTQ